MKMSRAIEAREEVIASLTDTPEKQAGYNAMYNGYVNAAVTSAVKNINTPYRIIEYDGQLRQKIYPIFQDTHRPGHFFDFSADLYQPTKHFAGYVFNTLYFNLVVIWIMTFILFAALYFDVLKNIVKLLEGNRKFWRKEKE